MRKVQQKQWQIFCGEVLWKLVGLGNQRVTIDLLFPLSSHIDNFMFNINHLHHRINARVTSVQHTIHYARFFYACVTIAIQ
jgi:hypothetical protein